MSFFSLLPKSFKLALMDTRIYRYCKYMKLKGSRNLSLKKHYSSLPKEEYEKLDEKILKSWMKYKIAYWEFYMLQLEDKTMNQISEYLSYRDSSKFTLEANKRTAINILENKYKSFCLFSKYYGRRVMFLTSEECEHGGGINKLTKFVEEYGSSFIVKPLNLSKGRGVKKLSTVNEIVEYVRQVKECVVEDVIIQDESLAAFNKSSVNTLRICTVNYGNGEIDVMWPCLRMGRTGSFVDNAGHGGVFAAVDVLTGKTMAATDELHNIWEEHPDSKIKLVGFTIPRWEEAVAFVKELARNIPDAGFVGWDIALTKTGWVMVEGNSAPLIIYQMAIRKGILSEFHSMRNKYYMIRKGH